MLDARWRAFLHLGVVPRNKLSVTANADKLHIVDSSALIQRYACKECGAHMYGRIKTEHAFYGLDFVHVELADTQGWQEPQFAAFVSSIIEQGFDPLGMDEVRSRLKSVGLRDLQHAVTTVDGCNCYMDSKEVGKAPA